MSVILWGLDADKYSPRTILSGDDNFQIAGTLVNPGLLQLPTNSAIGWTDTRHIFQGNILFADDSVQQLTSNGLHTVLFQTQIATNQFAIP
ncbi:MAG TPA: hypothetical protein VGN23_02615 [Verrucomicrobiae bacterium]|jgi:hypothetical protein